MAHQFLMLIAGTGVADALSKTLLALVRQKELVDVRLNATLCCFETWLAVKEGQFDVARVKASEAEPYTNVAIQNGLADTMVTPT